MAAKIPPNALKTLLGAAVVSALVGLVQVSEGTKYETYRDPVGVLTYCTGATEDAIWGKTYTKAECEAQLERDLYRHAVGVIGCIQRPMEDRHKVAFVDLAYNIGIRAFCTSTTARRFNEGNPDGACDALLMWHRAGGRSLLGLVIRRQKERAICLGLTPLPSKSSWLQVPSHRLGSLASAQHGLGREPDGTLTSRACFC